MRRTSAFLLACLLVLAPAISQGASIVKATYSIDGNVIALTTYTGDDGGPNSDPKPYWDLLGKAPEIVSQVTIKPDQKDGTTATIKGKISISVTIGNNFSVGTVRTESLTLVRDKANSEKWYLPAEELKRIKALAPDKEAKKAVAAPQPESAPLAPGENRRPPDWKPSRTAMDPKSLIEASTLVRQKAAKAYEELQQINASGKWKASADSIAQHRAPEWFMDAKFGMFIDWGPWSIAGWAPKKNGQMIPDWYENDMYKRADFAAYHEKNWGKDFQRDDFLALFKGEKFDPKRLVELAEQSGMKYVVPFCKHHAGLCLWPSEYTQRDVADVGPKRDVMDPLVRSCREKNLKFGFYFSVEEWEFPILDEKGNLAMRGFGGRRYPFNPNDIQTKITGKIPVKDYTTEYLVPQAKEFIDRYDPDLIWYDGEWETDADALRTKDIAAYLYNRAEGRKEVAVNDRYGRGTRSKLGDFFTSEFGHMGDQSKKNIHPWEECRGISQSYGYNWQDTDGNVMSAKDLTHMFVDIVAGGGNLLLMVNLDGQGAIPKIQEDRLREMGKWLKINGEGIYATRPYRSANQRVTTSAQAVMTQSKDGRFVYLILKEWPGAQVTAGPVEPKAGSKITMLGHDEPLKWFTEKSGFKVQMPESLQTDESRAGQHTWVLKIESSKPAP
jgi:alpha-L-fucosidase